MNWFFKTTEENWMILLLTLVSCLLGYVLGATFGWR